MQNYPKSLERMLAAWNEQDSSKIREHLNSALDEDVHFVDPNYDIIGIDAFEAMVHAVQKKIPGAAYSHTSKFDTHHNLYRYHWAIHLNGELVMPGFDVTEVDASGKITKVIGFFSELNKS